MKKEEENTKVEFEKIIWTEKFAKIFFGEKQIKSSSEGELKNFQGV